MGVALVVAAVLAVAVLSVVLWRFLPSFLKFRGKRVLTCPETQKTVAVEVDAKEAAVTALKGRLHLQLQDCTRWPERGDCGQECLTQVVESPEDCLVRTMLTRWYEGKTCVFCGTSFGELNWYSHRPALADKDRRTYEWSEIPAEKLPEILENHEPVCWDCHTVESMIRKHPDRVTFRP